MKIKLFSLVLMVTFFLLSCSNEKPSSDTASTEPTTDLSTPVLTIPDTTATTATQTMPVTGTTTLPAAPVTTAKGSSGKLNPAHGQPGHRCEIAVGAPLDGSPAPSATPAPKTASPITAKPVTPAATTTTAPGMNPAHGQPGHRCDIAVGAPLDSKPKQ